MTYWVKCRCGNQIAVRPSQAGTPLQCPCGLQLRVPSLSTLSRMPVVDAELDSSPPSPGQPSTAARADQFPPKSRRSVLMLTRDHQRRERVDETAFGHFVEALVREIEYSLAEQPPDRRLVAQVSFALLPDEKRLIQIDVCPSAMASEVSEQLRPRLERLAAPPVNGGPVALLVQSPSLSGPPSRSDLPAPFSRLARRVVAESLESMLMRAAGLQATPPRHSPLAVWLDGLRARGWWRRLSRLLPILGRRDAAPPEEPGPPLPAEIVEQIELFNRLAASGGLAPLDHAAQDAASLTRLIACYPDDARLYGMRGDWYKQQEDFERAIADYSELLARLPHNSTGYLVRAESLYSCAQRRRALADVNKALECNPANTVALIMRAAIFWDLGGQEQALADYEAAIQANPQNPTWYAQRARRRASRGEFAQALADCDAALRCDPHDSQTYLLRAMVRRQQAEVGGTLRDDIEAIVADCSAALAIEPANASMLAVRAEVKMAAKRRESAWDDCQQALQMDPDCALAYAVRASIHRSRWEFEQAVADCTAAIQRGLEEPRVLLCRAESLAANDDAEPALEDCERALQLQPDHVDAYAVRARIHLQQGESAAAIEACNAALEIAGDWPVAYLLRGQAHLYLDELSEAEADLDQAVLLAPEDASARFYRGLVRYREKQPESAMEDFDRVVELDDEYTQAYFQRSVIWMQKGEFEKARLDLEEVLLREPEFAPAYFNRGNVFRSQGNLDAALRDFDAVIDLCPTMAYAYSCRGDIWIEKGDTQRAQQDYREAIRLEPGAAEQFTMQRLMTEAVYHQRCEQYAEVIARTTETLDIEPDFLPAYSIRAGARWYAEEYVEAAEDYSHVLDADGDAFTALSGRGQVLAEMGEYDAALKDLNRAVELAEANPATVTPAENILAYVRNGRGLAYAGLERYAEAQRDFEASRDACPENAWLYYNLGRMHHQRGQTGQAAECFRAALEKQSPPLPPRKRSRARAYLAAFDQSRESGHQDAVS